MKKPNSFSYVVGDLFFYIFLFIANFFLFAFALITLCGIIAGSFSRLPDIVSSICIVLSLGLSARLSYLQIKQRRSNRAEEYNTFQQNEQADKILLSIDVNLQLINEVTDVALFVKWYDEILSSFKQLMNFDKVTFKKPLDLEYSRIKREFQWHLCDAIMRSKHEAMSKITGKYKYSKEHKVYIAESFISSIESIQTRFSDDTAELADKAVNDICQAAGLPVPSKEPEPIPQNPFVQYGGIDAILLDVDLMDGTAFELWCASLLSKIGFVQVDVTKKSGDQGVDILAQKDGIRYAIQCKCYSKDLGNSPVQEVNAGKVIYKCHVGAVLTNRYFTSGAKEAAAATGVLLWDRDWIVQQLNKQ